MESLSWGLHLKKINIMTNYFDDDFDESQDSENNYDIEEVADESPDGGLVLQVLDYRGNVEDIIVGMKNIREYIDKMYPV